ncbi:MAG: hypothetical protein EAZ61_07940 [Oscillatoriales cyanobacterium]|nr:MAG: hypothetical protein EAZ61_07940 [Oscillatoriales cyanobacterium]
MPKAPSRSATTATPGGASAGPDPTAAATPSPSSPSGKTNKSGKTSKSTDKKSRFDALDALEMTSIVGAGIGIGVAAVTQQLVHFALPLTLAMGLGTVNRQRFQQRMQTQYVAAVGQLQQSLKLLPDPVNLDPMLQQVVSLERSNRETVQQVEILRQELRQSTRPEQVAALRDAVVTLQNDLRQMQEFVGRQRERERHLVAQISELREWFQMLPRQQQSSESQRVESAIAVLQRELGVVKARLAPLDDANLEAVQGNIRRLEEHIKQLSIGVGPIQRQQRDIVRRLFPRLIATIKEMRQPEHQPAQKAAIDRPPLPQVDNVIRTSSPLNQATPRPDQQRLAAWQAQVQANMLRQRQQQRNQQQRSQQQQRQGDTGV